MRICLVCNEYPPGPSGGIGTFVQTLGRALVAAGHAVYVPGLYRPDYGAPEREIDQGVEVLRLRASGGRLGGLADRVRFFRTVRQWVRTNGIELVEVPDFEGWTAFWPRLPVPVVVRLHGSVSYFAAEMGRHQRRRMFYLERAALRRADAWCSVSRYTAEKTQQLFALRHGPDAILHNPVAVTEDPPFASRTRQEVVFTGTLAVKKGIISLIQAWPLVTQECPAAVLHVFGKDTATDGGGSMRAGLEAQLAGQPAGTVQFHGHVPRDRVLTALRGARLAVFPSYAEAFAFAPLEAMALGCPTIHSRRGAGPELMEDGRQGLLVDPDQPRDIAGAILRILRDDDLARTLSAAGRQRVIEKFSLPVILWQNEAFYRQCIQRSWNSP